MSGEPERRTYRGSEYRVRTTHPRRGGPLVVTTADGRVLGTSGETCDGCTSEELESMIANDYVERLDAVPVDDAEALEAPADAKHAGQKRRTSDRK